MENYEVIIIGSGPAGLTAAIYSSRARLKTLVLAGTEYGGQLMNTTLVENYPGFKEGVMGPELMMNMVDQAKNQGAEFVYDYATEIDFENKTVKAGENEYKGDSIIIATGSSPRKLGIPGEDQFYGKGVSTCATCDGAFFREKVIAVVGGGDSAMEEATFLTKFASKVYLIHRKDEFRASKAMQERALNNDKIEVLWNSEVTEVVGEEGLVSKIMIYNNKEESNSELEVSGLFLAIGHIPNSKFVGEGLEIDNNGFIAVKSGTKTHTSVEGIFVAGDVHDFMYEQAITAAGMGCMAAMDSEKWLASKE
jgi:thioredoxin reductase (NADPH)